jgi:hypothetical protein
MLVIAANGRWLGCAVATVGLTLNMRILVCGLVLVVVKVLTEFFPGFGDRAKLFPRSPRLEFDEARLLL